MQNQRIWRVFIIAATVALMGIMMVACGDEKIEDGGSKSAELSKSELDSLLEQTAENDYKDAKDYEKYMKDEVFASADVFGIDRDGDNGRAYVRLHIGEYVVLKDKAYYISGATGEAIIEFSYSDDSPKFKKLIWSADGEDHGKWLEDNFPEDYLKKAESSAGNSIIQTETTEKAEKALGVPVEEELQLEIDLDKGTYEIYKTRETGDPSNDDYKFETETVEKGKLSDLES